MLAALFLFAGMTLADPALVVASADLVPAHVATSGAPVTFVNVNTHETESVVLPDDGVVDADTEARITHLFRCRRTGKERKPDQGLLQMLARLAHRYPGRVFEVVSAHRAAPASVRTSQHYSGHAIDLRIDGISLVELRTVAWQMHDMPRGVGHYHERGFIHIDHRPGEPTIGWDQRRKGQGYQYNPRWAILTN